MTPAAMLKRLPDRSRQDEYEHLFDELDRKLNWAPAPRTKPIIIPSGGISAAELLFMEQSACLEAGKCPVCQATCSHEVEHNQMVVFRCTKHPVFHEFRRTQSFLTRD
jgi:hypothetical protein